MLMALVCYLLIVASCKLSFLEFCNLLNECSLHVILKDKSLE